MRRFFTLAIAAFGVVMAGCSATSYQGELGKDVAKTEFTNHYNTPAYVVHTSEDVENVVVYLPKDTTVVRLKMKVANLEDIVYMKLVDESPFAIDKVLRRVENIDQLGLGQDGYMYEPSVEKNIITLQVFVPAVYLYKSAYKPKLVYAYKRNARVLQDSVELTFLKKRYYVYHKEGMEYPAYGDVAKYCENNSMEKEYFDQLFEVNTNRVDEEFIKELRALCTK